MSSESTTSEIWTLANTRLTAERLNLLTHALGLLLSLAAVDILVPAARECGDPWRSAGCLIYAISLVAVYTASTLSHAFERPRLRNFFRTLDQVCIFFLIAGTYTPWGLTYYRDQWGLLLLGAIWTLAIVGALVKLLVKGHDNVAVAFYILLGWLPVLAAKPILQLVPRAGLLWLLAGGVCYTLGTYFLNRDERTPYFHAIWHLMVIAGSACHFAGILWVVVPGCQA